MCTGAEIGLLGLGTSGLGALGGANAAANSATATQIQMQFNAQMAQINADLNESNAQATLLAGERQVQNIKLHTAQLKSSQRASMAANGIDLGSSTPVNVLTSTDLMGEIDAHTATSNAVRQAWGYRTQAANSTAQAMFASASASSISPSAAFTSSLLGGASQVALNWYTGNKGAGLITTAKT